MDVLKDYRCNAGIDSWVHELLADPDMALMGHARISRIYGDDQPHEHLAVPAAIEAAVAYRPALRTSA